MISLNKIMVVGNCAVAPELKYVGQSKDIPCCNFCIVVNDGWGDKKRSTFLPVTAFYKTAEFANQYIQKGSKVFVEGKIQCDEWEDRTTKEMKKKYFIVADKVQFAETKAEAEDRMEQADRPDRKPGEESGGEAQKPFDPDDPDDDLPF